VKEVEEAVSKADLSQHRVVLLDGQGWGEGLMIDALQRGVGLADTLGIYAVEVDVIDQQAWK
jgi:hypothetical protein